MATDTETTTTTTDQTAASGEAAIDFDALSSEDRQTIIANGGELPEHLLNGGQETPAAGEADDTADETKPDEAEAEGDEGEQQAEGTSEPSIQQLVDEFGFTETDDAAVRREEELKYLEMVELPKPLETILERRLQGQTPCANSLPQQPHRMRFSSVTVTRSTSLSSMCRTSTTSWCRTQVP